MLNSDKNESDSIINNIKQSTAIVLDKNFTFKMDPNDLIENQDNTAHAVFAHKNIGENTLNNGYSQEDIRFCISPECIIIMLLCYNEPLQYNECISIHGAERFSQYTMNSRKFVCGNSYSDKTPKLPDNNILNTHIFAFNAINYATAPNDQYIIQNI